MSGLNARSREAASRTRAVSKRLREAADPVHAAVLRRFFKTAPGDYGAGDRFLGVRVPALRKLVRDFKDLALSDVDALLQSPWYEERALALLILVHQYPRADAARRESIYRLYLRRTARINNWDLVDCSAEHIVGAHLHDGNREALGRLARSQSVWERRIAIMSTFHDVKRGEFAETLRIARLLLDDSHDLIHKAVGWMLREVGKRDRRAKEAFLRTHAAQMPRTMLRYAIERFPQGLRRRYLAASRLGV